MPFFEWMNDKYPDPDSACGELTVYLRNIDALRTAVAYADFIPYLLQHSMSHKMTRMFSACWFRYNFGSSTYSNAYMRMSGTDTNYEPYIECVFSGSTAVG